MDPGLQRKIAGAVPAAAGDPVVEIGPGRGALTRHLVERSLRLTLVELDDDLCAELESRYAGNANVEVVHGDVMALDLPALVEKWSSVQVVGNIPYNITTPIVFRLLSPPRPRGIVVTVQAEVARRIVAPPGTRTYGALSVGVQLHAGVERICKVPRSAFRPVPRVDSVALRITPHLPPLLSPAAAARVRRLTRAAFSWRRKQLGAILTRHPELGRPRPTVERLLGDCSLAPELRPEDLSPGDFVALAAALSGPARRP